MKYPETVNELIQAVKKYNDYEKKSGTDEWCSFVLEASMDLQDVGFLDCSTAGIDLEEDRCEDSYRFIKEENGLIELRYQIWDASIRIPMYGYIIMPKGQKDIGYVRLVSVSRTMHEDYPDEIDEMIMTYERCDNEEVVDEVNGFLKVGYAKYAEEAKGKNEGEQ